MKSYRESFNKIKKMEQIILLNMINLLRTNFFILIILQQISSHLAIQSLLCQTDHKIFPVEKNSYNQFYQTIYQLYSMQRDWKLVKKTSKSAHYKKQKQNFVKNMEINELLKIDLINIPQKKSSGVHEIDIQSRQTSRKSHKSLAAKIKTIQEAIKVKQLANHTGKAQIIRPGKKKKKQNNQQTDRNSKILTQKHEQSTSTVSQEYNFAQKKLKIGKKLKSNAMKDFILETLNKAKAEATCLVIHKGTAHTNYSPINKNKSSLSKHEKEEIPLGLNQQNKIDSSSKKLKKSIFAGNIKKLNRNGSNKSTAINLPSINKKWVKIARQLEKKPNRQQIPNIITEIIEQNIECVEEQGELEEIKQQIIERNESIIQVKAMNKY